MRKQINMKFSKKIAETSNVQQHNIQTVCQTHRNTHQNINTNQTEFRRNLIQGGGDQGDFRYESGAFRNISRHLLETC